MIRLLNKPDIPRAGYCSRCGKATRVEAEWGIRPGTASTDELIYVSRCCGAPMRDRQGRRI